MCLEHYESLIANRTNYVCFICGRPLQNIKIEAQYQNQREISNHIHEGECMQKWTIIHNVASAQPDVVSVFGGQIDQGSGYLPQGADLNHRFENDDSIDGEMVELYSSGAKAFPALERLRRHLPQPSEVHGFESARLPRNSYKGKKVRVIPKKLR
jgi:hypothetical protein